MIPKLIHYSWISKDPIPREIEECMLSWKRVLPDYEYMLWDAQRIDEEIHSLFVRESLDEQKWAFAADYVRLFAVLKYGGIWLDTDVYVLKSFDSLLCNRMFIGKEKFALFQYDGTRSWVNTLTAHCFGAEPGHTFLLQCMEYYDNRHFVLSAKNSVPQRLRYDMRLLPDIFATYAMRWGYKGNPLEEESRENLEECILILPYWYLDHPHYKDIQMSYCVHLQHGHWVPVTDGTGCSLASVQQKKKNLYYYLLTFINRILSKKRLGIVVRSY